MKARILCAPTAFDFYQRLVGAPQSKRVFVGEHVRARPGDRVLDLGCGTGELLASLPRGVAYVGIDIDQGYIERARKKFSGAGVFECSDISDYPCAPAAFDVVMAYGLLHHLDDGQCHDALELAAFALSAGGRALFAEPCRTSRQGVMERALMKHDRGRHIRPVSGYTRLMRAHLKDVSAEVLQGTYRIPYTIVVLRAKIER